ncbi:MAG: iron ABC transporter permease [Planctomycetaceae bacterium]|nr:iron ABC transporter permease [Planctomycetaceae bacterium]
MLKYFPLLLLTFVALVALPMVGRVIITPKEVLYQTTLGEWIYGQNIDDPQLRFEHRIYWESRFPRTAFAMLVGAGLSLCGMVFQALFRNPLATPYTLGVASGASFGAALSTIFAGTLFTVFLGQPATVWFAFGGAMLAMSVVYFLSLSRDISGEKMLLAGVAVNFFFASMILFLQFVSDPSQTFRMLRYTMGGFDAATPGAIRQIGPIVLAGSFAILLFGRSLNVIATGNDRAIALGINLRRFRTLLFLLTSVLVGAMVAVAGPIGFVGIMVPHICRFFVGPDHRFLAPATFLFGAIFLAACDTVACCVLNVGTLPVGIITSMLGGPFFLILLLWRN